MFRRDDRTHRTVRVTSGNSSSPALILLRFGCDAESVKRGLVLISILLFALPRADHPALPYGISGLDLCLIPLGLGLLVSFARRGDIALPRDPLFIYILLVPIIFLCSNLISFLFQHDREPFVRGVLQSFRRVTPAMLLLLLWQTTYRQSDLIRLCKLLVASTLLGAGLFLLLANGLLQPFALRGHLTGNPLAVLAGAAGFPAVADVLTNYRFAGNTGSPTTYGIICGMQLLMLLAMYRRGMIRTWFFLTTSVLLSLLLLATASKSALAITIPLYAASLSRRHGLLMVAVMVAVVILLARQNVAVDISSSLISAGESSLTERLQIHGVAADEVETYLRVMLLGEGWRSREVGWHSEPLELLMGLGMPLGALSMLVIYLYIPWRILRTHSSALSPFSSGAMMAMYAIMAFCSLFQDIIHDSNMLYVFVVLLLVLVKSVALDRDRQADGRSV